MTSNEVTKLLRDVSNQVADEAKAILTDEKRAEMFAEVISGGSVYQTRKPYVGIEANGDYIGFSSVNEPTRESTPEFVAVIGPFKTRRAQRWAVKYGKNNPHFQHVNDAERLSKEAATPKKGL